MGPWRPERGQWLAQIPGRLTADWELAPWSWPPTHQFLFYNLFIASQKKGTKPEPTQSPGNLWLLVSHRHLWPSTQPAPLKTQGGEGAVCGDTECTQAARPSRRVLLPLLPSFSSPCGAASAGCLWLSTICGEFGGRLSTRAANTHCWWYLLVH